MNKYLIDIFKLRKSVTLPGFGALMVANTKTGKMVINKFVKFDDGVLAKFIVEKEGIDLTEAKNLVAKFVKEIKAEVEKGGTYDIYNFGVISKDKSGELIFKSVNEKAVVSTVKKPETKKTEVKTEPVKKKETKKTEDKAIKKSKDELKKEDSEKVKSKNVFVPNVAKNIVDKVTDTTKNVTKGVKEKSTKGVSSVIDKSKTVKEKTTSTIEKVVDKSKDMIDSTKEKSNKLKDNTIKVTSSVTNKSKDVVNNIKETTKSKVSDASTVVASSTDKIVEKVVEKKKRRKLIPLLLLLCALCAMGYFGYKYQNQIKAKLGIGNTSVDHSGNDLAEENGDHDAGDDLEDGGTDGSHNLDAVTSDSLESDNTEEEGNGELLDTNGIEGEFGSNNGASNSNDTVEEDKEEIDEVPATPVTNVSTSINGSFHIVGGAFSEKTNADNYASDKGGVVLGRFDGLYLVALKSYDSRSDAQNDLSNLKSIASSAWIFKYAK